MTSIARAGSAAQLVFSARSICAAWLTLLAAGCTPPAPPDVKQAYIAERRTWVDTASPCYLSPFDEYPVKVVNNGAFVDVWVNGVHTFGQIDTGAGITIITPELAAAAHVELHDEVRMSGLGGGFWLRAANVPKIAVGSVQIQHPGNIGVYEFPGSRGAEFGINVGADLLNGLDYDIDFVRGKIRPYATSNCLTIDPPWRTTSTGLALTRGWTNSLGSTIGNVDHYHDLSFLHVTVPVVFPGGVVDAMFDTGSSHSLMSFAAARAIGLSRSDIHDAPAHEIVGMGGKTETAAVRRFADLVIGEDELHNFPIGLMLHFDRRDPPMILGMDYMRTHHFWLSYTTNALYIDSGEMRKLTPPLDHAHWIAGANQPAYPETKSRAGGKVDAECWVEADGSLTGCRVTSTIGEKIFADAVLSWLNGAAHPVMQPAYRDGKPLRQLHTWSITFPRLEEPKPPAAK